MGGFRARRPVEDLRGARRAEGRRGVPDLVDVESQRRERERGGVRDAVHGRCVQDVDADQAVGLRGGRRRGRGLRSPLATVVVVVVGGVDPIALNALIMFWA